MIKNILIFLIIFSPILTYSQEGTLKWGEYSKIKGYTFDILPTIENEFYTLQERKKFIFTSYHLNKFVNFQTINQGKIQRKIGNSLAKIVAVTTINNLPAVFLSDYFNGKNILYLQQYSSNCKPFGPAIELLAYNLPKTWGIKGEFSLLFSENKKFFCVEYDIPGKSNTNEHFGYKIFNSELKIQKEGNYRLPYTKNEAVIDSRLLTNIGDYFITTKIFNPEENRSFWSNEEKLNKIVCHQISNDTIIPFEINVENKRIIGLKIGTNENEVLSIGGLYSDEGSKSNGVKGFFYTRINYKSKQIIDKGQSDFGYDFITKNWTERAKKRAAQRMEQGKETPELYDYKLKNTYTLKDSSIIGLIEQYYVETITYTDPRTGYVSMRYLYHYNDIIAFKITKNNTFEWIHTIPKQQVSTNDQGYFSSFFSILTDSTIQLFFNDEDIHYDENGKWQKQQDQGLNFNFRRTRNILAKVNLELSSGAVSREKFYTSKEKNTLAVPRLFTNNPLKHEVILYLRFGWKEKFGILNY